MDLQLDSPTYRSMARHGFVERHFSTASSMVDRTFYLQSIDGSRRVVKSSQRSSRIKTILVLFPLYRYI